MYKVDVYYSKHQQIIILKDRVYTYLLFQKKCKLRKCTFKRYTHYILCLKNLIVSQEQKKGIETESLLQIDDSFFYVLQKVQHCFPPTKHVEKYTKLCTNKVANFQCVSQSQVQANVTSHIHTYAHIHSYKQTPKDDTFKIGNGHWLQA